MMIIITWLAFSIIAGLIASNKGRSGFGFFLLSIVFSPLIGILAALVAEKRGPAGGERKCPFCAEFIKQDAKACKHCGRDVPKISSGYDELTGEKITDGA